MKINYRRLSVAVAIAGGLLFGAVTVQATCASAYRTCIDANSRLYENCTDSVAAQYERLKGAADNYNSTVANIPQDDPERDTKIQNAKNRLDEEIADVEGELAGLNCEPFNRAIAYEISTTGAAVFLGTCDPIPRG